MPFFNINPAANQGCSGVINIVPDGFPDRLSRRLNIISGQQFFGYFTLIMGYRFLIAICSITNGQQLGDFYRL